MASNALASALAVSPKAVKVSDDGVTATESTGSSTEIMALSDTVPTEATTATVPAPRAETRPESSTVSISSSRLVHPTEASTAIPFRSWGTALSCAVSSTAYSVSAGGSTHTAVTVCATVTVCQQVSSGVAARMSTDPSPTVTPAPVRESTSITDGSVLWNRTSSG